jgi:hypothetical protein
MKRSLTKSQAEELLRAASLLPLNMRDRFITDVDSRLRSVKRQLTDSDVSSAIVATLTVLDVTTSHHFMCDATGDHHGEEMGNLRPQWQSPHRGGG